MRNFKDNREDERLACPDCHCQVSIHRGTPPLILSTKRLMVIHQNRLHEERPLPDRRKARRNSLQGTFEKYLKEKQPAPQKNSAAWKLVDLRDRYPSSKHESLDDVSTMDVYPRILDELAAVLTDADVNFVLYGSGALWLEGNPRPQRRVHIKDMDMCVPCPESMQGFIEETIRELMRKTIAATEIDFGNKEQVFTTKGKTMEFISPKENLQFSFNLMAPEEFSETLEITQTIPLLGNNERKIKIAGMKFIARRMFVPGGLLEKRLFRPDKTLATLMYAAMVVGLKHRTADEMASGILDNSIFLPAAELFTLLQEVSFDRYAEKKTEFSEFAESITKHYKDELDKAQKELAQAKAVVREAVMKGLQEDPRYSQRGNQAWKQEKSKQLRESMKPEETEAEDDYTFKHSIAKMDLRAGTLLFLLDCLDKVSDELWHAPWLPFENLLKIKRGNHELKEALFNLAIDGYHKARD
jgi:hypothetical protein